MPIPTEPIGSIPRPTEPIEAMQSFASGAIAGEELARIEQADVRDTLEATAHQVQMAVTEGRLWVKLAPAKGLLRSFVDLNNQVLAHFTKTERSRIGVHTCPGGDQDTTHSADVDYAELLPD